MNLSSWTKSALHRLILKSRRATWRHRTLPDFIIIGAQKSGTSSLYYYLSQHPQLIPSYAKEVHFFDGGLNPREDNFNKGPAWYRSHFPLKWRTHNHQKIFEATPLYIFNPLVPQRISELAPEVKLIAILQNPTARAISHYFHEKRQGKEVLPLMDAFQAEEERLKPVIDRKDYKSNSFIHHSYKSRGRYHEQLKRYFDVFPMTNMLVLNSQALFTQPHPTLRRVFQFIGVDPNARIPHLEPRNVGNERTEIAPEVYEYLGNYYRCHNQQLYDLIGENYDW